MGQVGDIRKSSAGPTMPADMQQWIASQYTNSETNPIIRGGEVTGRADLAYQVAAGVGLVKTPAGSMVITWDGGQTKLITQPSTTRTDVIFVDGTGQVDVQPEGAFDESKVIILDKKSLPAGATATTRATGSHNLNYALAYGAQLGWLDMYIEPRPEGNTARKDRFDWCHLRFTAPTDRDIQVRIHQCLYGAHAVGTPATDWSQYGLGSMQYWLYVDDVLERQFEISYNRTTEAKLQFIDFEALRGDHRVRIERKHQFGADPIHFGSPNNLWQPGSAGIWDCGVSKW